MNGLTSKKKTKQKTNYQLVIKKREKETEVEQTETVG